MQTTTGRRVDPRRLRSALTRAAGALNVALGAWLMASSWLIDERPMARNSARLAGFAIAVLSAIGFFRDEMRFVVTGVAIFLGFSAGGVFNLAGGALWNQLLVAGAVFLLALLPVFRPTDEQP